MVLSASDHLLPGEDDSSTSPDDARLWQAVYAELAKATENLISQLTERPAELSEAGRPGDALRASIRAQHQRFRERHAFWTARLAQITKTTTDDR